jgi:hypothetical protein
VQGTPKTCSAEALRVRFQKQPPHADTAPIPLYANAHTHNERATPCASYANLGVVARWVEKLASQKIIFLTLHSFGGHQIIGSLCPNFKRKIDSFVDLTHFKLCSTAHQSPSWFLKSALQRFISCELMLKISQLFFN